jgi:ribosomal protein S18 acetylase RimI-like enzyme
VGLSDQLDNPVWHSLAGPRRAFGTVRGGAGVLDHDVGPFGAVRDAAGWDDLRDLVGPGRATVVLSPPAAPATWTVEMRIPGVAMVAVPDYDPVDLDAEPLGVEHVDEVLALIDVTQPGPFARRTLELGGFVGVREEGVLVAIAGERFRTAAATEVSGVATLPSHRGRGLAGALTRLVSHRIQQRGETAFLHAAASNENAIRLYRALGFVLHRELDFVVVRAP